MALYGVLSTGKIPGAGEPSCGRCCPFTPGSPPCGPYIRGACRLRSGFHRAKRNAHGRPDHRLRRRPPRALGSGVGVLIHGRRAPILGRICMDQTLVDVTEIPEARAGDTAVLLGASGQEVISACDVARQSGTIANEILSRLGPRLERRTVCEPRPPKGICPQLGVRTVQRSTCSYVGRGLPGRTLRLRWANAEITIVHPCRGAPCAPLQHLLRYLDWLPAFT